MHMILTRALSALILACDHINKITQLSGCWLYSVYTVYSVQCVHCFTNPWLINNFALHVITAGYNGYNARQTQILFAFGNPAKLEPSLHCCIQTILWMLTINNPKRDFSFHGLACFPDYDEDDQSFSFSIGPMTVLHFRDVIVAVFIAEIQGI